MTLFEILNFNRELLERLAGTGYKPDDYKYIDLYKEYEQMRRKGEKVTYCVAFLSARPRFLLWDRNACSHRSSEKS